jgi:hypothetical protein
MTKKFFNKFQYKFLRPRRHSTNYKIPRSKVIRNDTQSETVLYEHDPAAATERLACRYRHTHVPPVTLYGLQAQLTDFRQSNSPSDWSAGHTTHVSSAFHSSTVQADRKAKLYMYGVPKEVWPKKACDMSFFFLLCWLSILCVRCHDRYK